MIIKGVPKYDDVLHIPEGKSGDFEIVHNIVPAGEKLRTASFRTAIHAGHRNIPVVYDHPTRWHKLLERGSVWMSDIPLEQSQHDRIFKGRPSPGFSGRVLVGGLGLGYACVALSARRRVREIVMVEQSQDVINLVYEHVKSPITTVVCADLHEYLARPDIGQFDFGFYDIWQSDGESTFHHTVIPLRHLSEHKVNRVECWNEDVMRGQLFNALRSRLAFLVVPPPLEGWADAIPTLDELADATVRGMPTTSVWNIWAQPYWRWMRRTKPTPALAERMAALYANLYGVGNAYLELALDEPVPIVIPPPKRTTSYDHRNGNAPHGTCGRHC